MRSKSRSVLALFSAVLLGGATLALAQGGKKPAVPPKKPPKVEAGTEESNPYGGSDVSKEGGTALSAEAGPAPTTSGSAVPAPLGLQTVGDGGRPSPLNPTVEEMPGKLDGGTPNAVDYDKLIADIAALRARVSAVGDSMFRSRVVVSVETDNDHAKIGRMTVSLDDGVVFTAPQNFRADDPKQVYAAGVAAGRHAITVDVDRADERNDAFKTSQRTRFLVDVPRDQELDVKLKIVDDSNMGKDFPGDQKGRYQLEVRMDAKAQAPKK